MFMAKILLVEDDRAVINIVQSWLEHEHHKVDCARDGAEALAFLDSYSYDVIVLDLTLPDIDGLEICRRYKTSNGLAQIIMLTGRNKVEDKELGLDLGSDDYLTKPFDVKELSARIRALLRRSVRAETKALQCGDLELDPSTYTVKKEGKPIKLHRQEYMLLEMFMRQPDTVLSARSLVEQICAADGDSTPDTLRTTIWRLRKQIDSQGSPSYIESVHGKGYVFRAPKTLPFDDKPLADSDLS